MNVAALNRDRASGAELNFVAPVMENGSKIVQVVDEDTAEELKRWKKALIVYVLGAKSPFHIMKQFIERKWGKFGDINMYMMNNGIFVIELKDCETCVEIMEAGPWTFDAKSLIILE